MRPSRRPEVGEAAVRLQSSVHVLPEAVAKRRPAIGGERLDPQVRGADRVCLVDDQLAPVIEATRGAVEGERDQQPQQTEDAGLDRADTRAGAGRIMSLVALAEPATELDRAD